MKSTIACVLAFVCFITGCKKDDPVGPGGTPADPASVTAVIGTSGGTLSAIGFSLIVPPAAFSADETLKVTAVVYDNAFGARAVTGLYKLEGVPALCAKPLEVRLEYTRTPSESLYIVCGREGTDIFGAAIVFYSPIPATKDSKYVKVSVLPDSMGGMGKKPGKRTAPADVASSVKWLLGVDEYTSMRSSSDNFQIFYPRYLEAMTSHLADALENAYTGFSQMGFDALMYDDLPFPVGVTVMRRTISPPSPPMALVPFCARGASPPWVGMVIPEQTMAAGDVPTIQRATAQTFCDLFFTMNDDFFWQPRDAMMLQVERNRIWPYFAVGAWAAEYYAPAGTGGGAPLNFRQLCMCPFDGLTVELGETAQAHGLGLSPLIEYIRDTYTSGVVLQLYYKIPDVDHAIDAFTSTLPVPEREWWPGFLKEYVEGKIYNVTTDDLLKDLTSSSSPGVFTIQEKTDTLKTFSGTYADLSAKLYRVNLRYAGLDTSALLRFSVGPASLGTQDVGVMLFGLKNNVLTYWQYGNSVTVKQAKDLTASGYDIVAAVVNCLNASPYYGSNTLELTVAVESGLGAQKSASFRTFLKGTQTTDIGSAGGTLIYNSGFKAGTLSGGTFTATWSEISPDFPSGTLKKTGEIVIHVEGTGASARITGFSVKDTVLHTAYSNEVWVMTSSGSCNIPAYRENNRYVHRVSGIPTRNHVATTVNRYDSFTDGAWRSFSDPSGNDADLIEIIIE